MEDECSSVDDHCQVQLSGVLAKRPVGHDATKWSKRFFIIKDGFLLYYAESDKKVFEKQRSINLHPKGILPLGGSIVEAVGDPSPQYHFLIVAEHGGAKLSLAAETELERYRWIRAIEQASRITWRNAHIGDAMIQQLERIGHQMACEKQQFMVKLKQENEQSRNHELRAQELSLLVQELEQEKVESQRLMIEIKSEFEKTHRDLELKSTEVLQLEDLQQKLRVSSERLREELKTLEEEKIQISTELQRQMNDTEVLSRDKENLANETNELSVKLRGIESKMAELNQEKDSAIENIKQHELRSRELMSEKQNISVHADKLKHSLKELTDQKAITDVILKEEIEARLEAERRLQEAEKSLQRIETSLQQRDRSRPTQAEYDDLLVDVKTLKKFFENAAFEARIDAKKGDMIKCSLRSRKSINRRVKTTLFDNDTKTQLKDILRRPSRNTPITVASQSPGRMTVDVTSVTSPSSHADEVFEKNALEALNSPRVRNSCLALLQQLELQDL